MAYMSVERNKDGSPKPPVVFSYLLIISISITFGVLVGAIFSALAIDLVGRSSVGNLFFYVSTGVTSLTAIIWLIEERASRKDAYAQYEYQLESYERKSKRIPM